MIGSKPLIDGASQVMSEGPSSQPICQVHVICLTPLLQRSTENAVLPIGESGLLISGPQRLGFANCSSRKVRAP